MDLNNRVIEVLNRDHGRKVKAFFKKNGVDVSNFHFSNTTSNRSDKRFYGLRNNIFGCFSLKEVEFNDLTVITLPTQDIKSDLLPKNTRIKPSSKDKVKNLDKKDTSLKPRYFVQVTKENSRILNQYLHKHWRNYPGYNDRWEVAPLGKSCFCSESIIISDQHFHTVTKYPDLPTDSLLTTHEFLSLLDIELLNHSLSYNSGFKEKESPENPETLKYFVKITKNNVNVLNHFLHKNAHRYKGYHITWSISKMAEDSFFCSESIPFQDSFVHSISLEEIIFQKKDSFKIVDDLTFFAMFDSELYLELVATVPVTETRKKAIDNSKSFPIQPDFSPADLIILKHLLDSNIKFDANDFNFNRGLFQLGYDFATSTRVY